MPYRLAAFPLCISLCFLSACSAADGGGKPAGDRAPGGPPAHAEWALTFRDEFEGDALDWDVWESASALRGPNTGRWPENNVVRDGILRQVTRRENPPRGGRPFSSAHIWTRHFTQQYGYFEARIRCAPHHNNAFWLWRPAHRFEEQPHFEIDIVEGHTPHNVQVTLHFDVYPEEGGTGEMFTTGDTWRAPVDIGKNFHVYGLEWNEKEIIWYFDGKPIRRLNNFIGHAPADVRFSTLGRFTILQDRGTPFDVLDGQAMEVDWVRVYRKVRDTKAPENMPPLEQYDIPKIRRPEPRIEVAGQRRRVFEDTFNAWPAEGVAEGWTAPNRPSHAVADRAEGPRPQRQPDNRVLKLERGDYVYRLFDESLKGRAEISFDLWHAARQTGLLVMTLGEFDETDDKARRLSWYEGDIGPYIFWQRHFVSEYTEPLNWQPVTRRPNDDRWNRVRIVLDFPRGIFDMYIDGERVYQGSGDFRHRAKLMRGFGLRHRGHGPAIFIDNIRVEEIR